MFRGNRLPRLARKAQLARASRRRKKQYVTDLEEKTAKLESRIAELQIKQSMMPPVLEVSHRARCPFFLDCLVVLCSSYTPLCASLFSRTPNWIHPNRPRQVCAHCFSRFTASSVCLFIFQRLAFYTFFVVHTHLAPSLSHCLSVSQRMRPSARRKLSVSARLRG